MEPSQLHRAVYQHMRGLILALAVFGLTACGQREAAQPNAVIGMSTSLALTTQDTVELLVSAATFRAQVFPEVTHTNVCVPNQAVVDSVRAHMQRLFYFKNTFHFSCTRSLSSPSNDAVRRFVLVDSLRIFVDSALVFVTVQNIGSSWRETIALRRKYAGNATRPLGKGRVTAEWSRLRIGISDLAHQ